MSFEKVVIMPHPPIALPEIAGNRFNEVELTANNMLSLSKDIVNINPDTIIIITPHSVLHPTAFTTFIDKTLSANFNSFGAPHINFQVNNNSDLINLILQERKEMGKDDLVGIKPGTNLDHGSGVPLYYLLKAGYTGKIVVINYTHCDIETHLTLGQSLLKATDNYNKKVVLLSSGDLSHKISKSAPAGYHEDGEKFDKLIIDSIEKGNYDTIIKINPGFRFNAGECAFNSLMIAFGALNCQPKNNKIYSYQAPFGVGYLVASL